MKRIISVFLILLLSINMVGCGGEKLTFEKVKYNSGFISTEEGAGVAMDENRKILTDMQFYSGKKSDMIF